MKEGNSSNCVHWLYATETGTSTSIDSLTDAMRPPQVACPPALPVRAPALTANVAHSAASCERDVRSVYTPGKRKRPVSGTFPSGRYWARTSDPQLVELVLSQLS